ncbi:ribosomal protein S18-alanine N-acetyltransferase [Halonotius sp. F2-221B]|uniref:ribosomal protein S18-alanine N-acetyltransferase n=1 Tax=Halonotius sp. F2-221B TaxID=2731620 RepID=UPI00398B4AB1
MATSILTGDDSPLIREATRADLLSIYRIETQVFDQPWPYPVFEGFLDEPNFLVAVTNGSVAGYVVGDVTPTYGRDIGHIKDLAVHPTAQGNGIGRRLLQRAVLGLTVEGVGRIKLEVRKHNTPARELYRSEGFEPVTCLSGYYDDGEDAIVLAKQPERTSIFEGS